MSSDLAIELRHVWKKYPLHNIFHRSLRDDLGTLFKRSKKDELSSANEFWALEDIDLQIPQGDCLGLFGHNGAGKSTILKIIARVTYPERGEITVSGRVAPLIEIGAGFHPDLTGRENIFVNGTILGMSISSVRQRMDTIIAFSELERFIDLPIKKYSSGMYLRLGFAIAVHSDAEIMLLDEIMAVGDAAFQKKCANKIAELRQQGCTMLVVSHDMQRLQTICDRIVRMDHGRIV